MDYSIRDSIGTTIGIHSANSLLSTEEFFCEPRWWKHLSLPGQHELAGEVQGLGFQNLRS